MNVRSQLRNFWASLRSDEKVKRHRHAGHSLAKTVSDASTTGGARGGGRGATGVITDMSAKSYEAYSDSFKDD